MSTLVEAARSRWPEWTAVLFAALIAATGLVGLIGAPSQVITETVGTSVLVYSIGLVGGGVTMGAAVVRGWRRTELLTMLAIAALTLLHSAIIALASGEPAAQTAGRILAAAIGVCSWAGTRWQRGITRPEIEKHLQTMERR